MWCSAPSLLIDPETHSPFAAADTATDEPFDHMRSHA